MSQGRGVRGLQVAGVLGVPALIITGAYLWGESRLDASPKGSELVSTGQVMWGIFTLMIAGVIAVAGYLINDEWFGAFIDSRNRYSLSRVQIAAWTTVVLAAWLAVAMVRAISLDEPDHALQVSIPGSVLLALGLSTGAFALSAAIKDQKGKQVVAAAWWTEAEAEKAKIDEELASLRKERGEKLVAKDKLAANDPGVAEHETAIAEIDRSIAALTTQRADIVTRLEERKTAEGLLARNASPSDAAAGDLFRGEEVSDVKTLDFSKVQMLFVSAAVIGAYAISLASALGKASLFTAAEVKLPGLPDSMVTLLGFSHGGYLAVKASTPTKVAPG